MGRLERYLDVLGGMGVGVLLGLPLLVLVGVLATPREWRLPVALGLAVLWLVLGRMPGLGVAQALAKASTAGAFVVVAWAAMLAPGPKLRLPPLLWIYPITAVLAFVYILRTPELLFNLAIRFNWLLLVCAALLTARTLTGPERIWRVVVGLAGGALVSMLLPLSALLGDPGAAFLGGLGRFRPYGANPNQIGVMLVLTTATGLYFAVRSRRPVWRFVFIFAVASAIGMGMLTASRSIVFLFPLVALPVVFTVVRRPAFLVLFAAVSMVGLFLTVRLAESDVSYGRLASLQTGRYHILREYMGVVAQRPFFGLLTEPGASAIASEAAAHHPHNAYIEALYIGGLSYALPLFILVAASLYNVYDLWRKRALLGIDPLLISTLSALLIGMYLHGLVNGAIYYPTYMWAFVHVLLSCFFITWGSLARHGHTADSPQSARWSTSSWPVGSTSA